VYYQNICDIVIALRASFAYRPYSEQAAHTGGACIAQEHNAPSSDDASGHVQNDCCGLAL